MIILVLQNDITDVLDLTFSIDADEEKLILYERTEVMSLPGNNPLICGFMCISIHVLLNAGD